MFILFDEKHRTETVPDGIRVHRPCPQCGKQALFIERMISTQFRLYFIEMFTHGTHHVLECTECTTTFVTDEVKDRRTENDHSGTLYGVLQGAVSSGKQTLGDRGIGGVLDRAAAEVDEVVDAAGRTLGGLFGRITGRDDGSRKP